MFNHAIAEGGSVSLETTLTGMTVLKRIRDAHAAGYEVSIRYVALASVELHINRIEQRVLKGGHHIPTETLMPRYEASLDNLPVALAYAGHATTIDIQLARSVSCFAANLASFWRFRPCRRRGLRRGCPPFAMLWRPMAEVASKEESASFLKKRSKKLLCAGVCDDGGANAPRTKFFASFFSKKKRLPCLNLRSRKPGGMMIAGGRRHAAAKTKAGHSGAPRRDCRRIACHSSG
jgi:hypothetical protein